MSEISKAYEPQSVEDKWYQFWLDEEFFVADPKSPKAAYSIVIPPPNVTGVLTMGHVLNNTIQDILSRKARMDGKEVLWLPGTDHAGIATQTIVERTLKKSGEIKHRDDLGREKFLERVWQWKEKHGGIIIQQLKKLGASCDWSRERFTMDSDYSRCVQKVFVDLYKKGLIYRRKRMVNWDPVSLTAISDEEVNMKEQKGSLYYFKVEVAEAPGTFLTIATTRPETIPGDTAVAVNPKDPRYAKFIGKRIVRPLPAELPRDQKLIPIIGDEHVDFEFGTGVLKVTPAHDKADNEIGLRHKLPEIDIMHPNGHMNELAGQDLNGLDRFKARKVAAEKLTELGLLEKEEPYTNNVGFSERTDVPIEPRLSEQWFLKYPSAEKSRAVVADGKMKFFPDRWAKVYDHWMGSLQDWCISRQLWWGHRIPVWRNGPEWIGSKRKQTFDLLWESRNKGIAVKWPATKTIVTRPPFNVPDSASELASQNIEWTTVSVEVAIEPGNEDLASKLEQLGFVQDPDVLDTWFSSWLWPFATMGWPEQTETLKKFYPTTDLVTGPDIIFFWVARMIMAGYEFMGEMPFKNVYFTGIIRDKQGRKMSKMLGNSPNPLDLIAQYGADALRFGVMRAAPLGQDILFDEQNVELGRNFCNKLWNACRFRQMQGGEVQAEINPEWLTPDDKWILLKLDTALREIAAAFSDYKFSDATATLYRFFWSEYCDWYIEASKAVLQGDDAARKSNTIAVIDFVLSHTLRMFHPFLPFITEELWHGMGYSEEMPDNQGGRTIMFAPWPKPLDDDFKSFYKLAERDEKLIEARNELVTQGRDLRRQANIPANKKVKFVFKPNGHTIDAEVLKLLLNAETVEVDPHFQPPKNALAVRHEQGDLFLPLEGLVDVEAERARLKKELEKIEGEIAKVEQKLANPNFTQKVPATVLEEHKKRLADWQARGEHVRAALEALGP
ncbi:MAG TPA: valine--tRNA ligase [Candidatus Sulfotelmatobacter sp.]|nr:valine--tRNA ligase [Candidatus Sulfotelmatobacter sp.]